MEGRESTGKLQLLWRGRIRRYFPFDAGYEGPQLGVVREKRLRNAIFLQGGSEVVPATIGVTEVKMVDVVAWKSLYRFGDLDAAFDVPPLQEKRVGDHSVRFRRIWPNLQCFAGIGFRAYQVVPQLFHNEASKICVIVLRVATQNGLDQAACFVELAGIEA